MEPTSIPWPPATPGKKLSFGGVLIDDEGRILVRKVAGSFDGGKWTFPKGRPDAGEQPLDAAIREVLEETGYAATPLAPVPGSFDGTTTTNRYWLMKAGEQVRKPDRETERVAWCTPAEAAEKLGQSPSTTKRKRDLAVLADALKVLATL